MGMLGVAAIGCTRSAGPAGKGYPGVSTLGLTSGAAPAQRHAAGRSRTQSELGARAQLLADLKPVAGPDTPLEMLLAPGDRPLEKNGLCPPDMASVDDLYCVDRYEASLLEVLPNGEERPWTPYVGIEGHVVRAVSEPHLVPQGHISAVQAGEACRRSGKRLCKAAEWKKACMGPEKKVYGYSDANEPRRCNDYGRSPVTALFGSAGDASQSGFWNWSHMNDPELNQLAGTLAKTGEHPGCTNGYGVYDMVGNLHEWVDDPRGTFLGGYYQDTHENGDGCTYRTMAHNAVYHDYSTGFRCCADVGQ
jgi:hypothetical protein